MKRCLFCKDEFPVHLVEVLRIRNQSYMSCPICALKEINKTHGLPENTPFHGEQAKANYDEAIAYLKGKMSDE